MRRLILLVTLALLVAGCGEAQEPTTTEGPSTTTTPVSTTSTGATTATALPTTSPIELRYTVESLGRAPERALSNTRALGSGCSPGGGTLHDGVWFGWIESADASSISFDLACMWPGRIDPAVGNDSTRLRTLTVRRGTLVYPIGADPIEYPVWLETEQIGVGDNAPGLPDTTAFWVFVNDGTATEIAVYPDAIPWMLSAGAWPEGLEPGCCDMGEVAPPSPSVPWPDNGWPADGFYDVSTQRSDTSIDLVIRRYLSCRDNPGLCPEWWVGDEVIADSDGAGLERTLMLDENLIVVIEGVGGTLVGDGTSYASLQADIDEQVESWISGGRGGLIEDHFDDPSFPFGYPSDEEGWPYMYRGPAGSHLTFYEWWTALEIRDGSPVLYFRADLIAG